MHISKIKFLREGKGKIGLNGKSYSFRRINKNVYSAPFKNKLLGKTNPIHISLSYSSKNLFSDFSCMRSKSKDQILEYFPESIEEMETMKEAIIRNRSTLITLETSKHENSFHSGGSKLLVTELLRPRSRWWRIFRTINLNILSVW